jgi:hypothetical protein
VWILRRAFSRSDIIGAFLVFPWFGQCRVLRYLSTLYFLWQAIKESRTRALHRFSRLCQGKLSTWRINESPLLYISWTGQGLGWASASWSQKTGRLDKCQSVAKKTHLLSSGSIQRYAWVFY